MGDPNPQVVVIAGPNGAGKSTLAPFLLRDTFGLMEFVNADSIAAGLSAFQPEGAAIEAGRVMLKRLRDLAAAQVSFAFETTLATRSYAHWLAALKRGGYNFHLLFLWLHSPELAAQRVHERVMMGGHSVPEEVISRRYAKGLRNFSGLYRPIADSWLVYDNSSSGRMTQVAAGVGNTTREVLDESLWSQFQASVK
ncbi:MAG: AAA family ATPase [Pyrinomonadaceae bacterium]